jgi:hypothetical protein
MRVDWTELKAFVDERKLSIQYVTIGNKYWLKAFDGPFDLETTIHKADTAPDPSDQKDFEDNYLPTANRKMNSVDVSGVKDPKGMRARLVGCFDGTATKTATSNIDWQMTQLAFMGVNKVSYFDGIDLCLDNYALGDTVKFQVVDVDNLYGYGAGFVLEEFGDTFKIFKREYDIKLYKAKIIPGMYLRIEYTSVGTVNDVRVLGNLYRHLNANEDA